MNRAPRFGETLIAPDGTKGVVFAIDEGERELRLATADYVTDWIAFADLKVPRISKERLAMLVERALGAAIDESGIDAVVSLE